MKKFIVFLSCFCCICLLIGLSPRLSPTDLKTASEYFENIDSYYNVIDWVNEVRLLRTIIENYSFSDEVYFYKTLTNSGPDVDHYTISMVVDDLIVETILIDTYNTESTNNLNTAFSLYEHVFTHEDITFLNAINTVPATVLQLIAGSIIIILAEILSIINIVLDYVYILFQALLYLIGL